MKLRLMPIDKRHKELIANHGDIWTEKNPALNIHRTELDILLKSEKDGYLVWCNAKATRKI